MAERRMFSKRILSSGRFIKMPSSTQCLYFHLGLQADDDGVAEAFHVMRYIGASEDDLKVLVAKGFITVLNEDLVTYINDWNENNKIRADRKVDSIYKDLLLKFVPEEDLIEKRERADLKKKREASQGERTSAGRQKDLIDQVRLEEESIEKQISVEQSTARYPYKEVIDYLNCKSGREFKDKSKDTRSHIRARIQEGFTLEDFKQVIDTKVEEWKDDKVMKAYIRPSTLFGIKFEGYLNQRPKGGRNYEPGRYVTEDEEGLVAKAVRAGVGEEFAGF